MSAHRRCVILQGSRTATAAQGASLFPTVQNGYLWISSIVNELPHMRSTLPSEVRTLLGGSFVVVVVDFHQGIDPDLLGQCQGLVLGGGVLVLRLSEHVRPSRREQLVVYPYHLQDVGVNFQLHARQALRRIAEDLTRPAHDLRKKQAALRNADLDRELYREPSQDPKLRTRGTQEQAQLITILSREIREAKRLHIPYTATLLAERGRGKSSSLGLLVKDLYATSPQHRIIVVAPMRKSAEEIFRFASTASSNSIEYLSPHDLCNEGNVTGPLLIDEARTLVLVDEAAQLSLRTLRHLVRRFVHADLIFSSTVHGYEGTGRGFLLRFMDWLREHRPHVHEHTLIEPIRWAPDDPLENAVSAALFLRAQSAANDVVADFTETTLQEGNILRRDQLLQSAPCMTQLFGLLLNAHYRTTPGDLERLMDAPNMRVYALVVEGHVVAATVLAIEGRLDDELATALYWGKTRIRGHALADSLITHLGEQKAGRLSMIRSVRIATHPALRYRGLARRLVEYVHEEHKVDLFGTLFGATHGLVSFRQQLGYRAVRLSASVGARTGEPSVMMLLPVSEAAKALVKGLSEKFAQQLPTQVRLFNSDYAWGMDRALLAQLRTDLPSTYPITPTAAEIDTAILSYVHGPRTFESVALELKNYIESNDGLVQCTEDRAACLIRTRVLQQRSWHVTMTDCGLPTIPATMRALRRAMRKVVELSTLKP